MIVVDSNVIAYHWLNGPLTAAARGVRARDADWHAPFLWRSEMRSILAGYLRDGTYSEAQIASIMASAEAGLSGGEHAVHSANVFEVIATTRLSAYDAEFVALAAVLSIPLVTADKAVLKAFPGRAMTMEAFANG
ncbi:MAG: type II toxin-antitoxin system VapC family toxin [Burkholderiales bacterium]